MVKIGRRGSLNAQITVQGVQGHVAYPARVDNPVHRLAGALAELRGDELDEGTEWFEPTSLQVTSVDVGNTATNLVPASATARLNIRFNDRHTGASLEDWLRAVLARHADRFTLGASVSGEAFLTAPARRPGGWPQPSHRSPAAARMDTGGGTSDARFIARYCPVAEFGLVGATMHMADEQVPVADLRLLTAIYAAVLRAFVP